MHDPCGVAGSATHRAGVAVAGWAPQSAAGGLRLGFGGLDQRIALHRVVVVNIGFRDPSAGRFHGVVPSVGLHDVGEGAVNCSWMIHVVRLCRLNLSAGAFSLHAD